MIGLTRVLALLVLATIFVLAGAQTASAGWYNGNWLYRKAITIDHTKVGTGPHTNFPLLVSITDATLGSKALSNGNDILFTSSDGTTKLNHEIESYTTGTGVLAAWVQIPSLSSTADTVIYMYYGDASASNQQSVNATWDSNYKGVYHLNGVFTDSTVNGFNGTNFGTIAATGKIANARGFVRSDGGDSVTISGKMGTPANLTLSGWAFLNSADTSGAEIVSIGDYNGLDMNKAGVGTEGFFYDGGWQVTTGGSFYTGAWHYFVYTFTSGAQRLYVDGALNGSASLVSAISYTGLGANTLIGRNAGGSTTFDFDGTIDEVRVSSSVRSAGWVQTEYNNQSLLAGFATLGAEQGIVTLASGSDPSNTTIAPGASVTMADAFTLQASSGTDTVSAITVSLGSGTAVGVSLVEITDSTGATVYGSTANPSSDTPTVTLTTNITATTTATTYKIRVTPKTHPNMAVPAGATYAVTALVSAFTNTLGQAGSDTAGATITIDNLSPGNVTAATAIAGNAQVSLTWTNPGDADLSQLIVLQRTTSVVTDTPAEGATYTVGNTIGSSTVACVVSAPTATCTDSGLTNGTAYYYKIFAKDSNGNYSAMGVVPTGSPATPTVTTLATGTDPSNATLAPGGAATMTDAFTLQTASGTDTVTAITVSLAAGTSGGVSLVEITDNAGSTVYGSSTNPASDTPAISLTTNITATTTVTTYKIRVTPKSHANMPVPAGSTYSVTAAVSSFTSSNAHAGSDTGGATITIDNLSPGNVSAATATAGNAQGSLAWTNPADADLAFIVVLRRTVSAVTDTPVEGTVYTVGNTIGSSTVACVVSAPTATCTDTGLTNGTAYYYKIFTKDSNGNYSATGVAPTGSPVTPNLTTLATGVDPSNASLAPGGAATMADAFTFQTSSSTDTITAITLTLAAGTSAGLSLVEIADSTGATVYGSATNPASDTPALSLTTSITATTTATTYKIRVTPKSHANMPAPVGATYSVTTLVSGWTGTNTHAGSDTAGATVTVDNLSPANVTSATATAGSAQVSLAWTNPADADLGSIVVLRRTVSVVTDTPVEGTTYTAGNTIGSSTVACVVSAPTAACTDTGLTNGTAYYYKIFAKDSNGNYAATGVVPTGSPVTPNLTTLATGVDPSNTSLAPGGAATMADAFTFQTASGTDTITAVTVTLAAGTSAGLSLVEITDSAGSTVYGSVTNPGSDTAAVSLTTSITATTSAATYKIRVTPKSHANMPAPAGATYSVTAVVSGWTGTNAQAGSDTAGATITIDNLSPGNVTSASVSAGSTQAFLAWTNPADADFSSVIVLRRSGGVVSDTPTEGATYSAGNTVGSSTVACVVSAPVTGCTDSGLTTGTAYYYKAFSKDTNGNYSASGTTPVGSPVTPAAGITVTPTSGLSVTEAGSTATFTVVLTSQPSASVVVGINSNDTTEGTVSPASLTFTIGNWNTPQTVTVTGVDDSLDDGDIAYSIITAAATSSDTGYSGINPSDVSVTTVDNDASSFTVTPTSGLTTTEAGGTATFTVVLTAQPTATVTVGLSSSNAAEGTVSPSSVTFTSGNWNTPQTVTVTGVDDVTVDGSVAYSIATAAASSADTNYNGLNPSDVSVTNTDNDVAGITVTPTSGLTTTEAGGTATFTVVLTSEPTDDVTINFSSSNTAEGTVSPSGVSFAGANAGLQGGGGGGGVILLADALASGGAGPAFVSFALTNWNVPQTVTVTGVDDSRVDGNVAYTIVTSAATSSDVHYNGLNPSDVSVTNIDNDVASITVTPTSGLATTEAGGAATFTVVLTSQPTANVTIGLSSSNTAEGTVSPSSVTFTSGNWNTPQTVTVTGVDDFLVDGSVAYSIVTAAATSSDPNYSGLNASDISVTNTDNDAAGITVTPTSGLTTTEAGGIATFTVVLMSQPTANVTIGLSSSNTAEGTVSPSSVTFTSGNWNTPQTVTVTGVDDFLVDGAVAYTVVTGAATSSDVHYSGLNASDVSVSNTDNDAAGVTVTPTSGLTTTEAGGAATFAVVLTSQPTANVTIGLSSSNTAEGTVSPAPVTFTSGNWNTPQTVTVTGVDDFLVDGAVAYTIVTAAATSSDLNYSGLNASDVSVTNTDNDAVGITVTPTSGLTTTEAGGTAAFTVVLTSQPTANVSIGLSSGNTAEGTVSPSSVTFTSGNWNVPQTVTVTGVDDFLVDGAVAYTIVTAAATSSDLNYSGLNASDVSVSNTDNDAAGITVTPTSGLTTTEAGGAATFTVVLASQPTANVSIGVSSSNTVEGTVSPTSVTFTSGNWNTPQTVTVTGVDDFLVDGAVGYTIVTAAATSGDVHYSGLNASDVSATNTDNDTAGVTVTPTSGLTTTEAGGTATFTVVLTSQPTANVTIGLSSSNTAEGTVAPSSVTFTSGNWNTPQTVTVTGVDDFLIDGAVVYTVVTAAATSSDVHYSGLNASDVSVTNTDNDAASITVTPTSGVTTTEAGGTATFSIVLTSQPTANVTIGVSSSNTAEGTVSPSSVTFTSGNWNTPQTVTVTGVDDFLVDGAVAYSIVTAAATSSDLNYSGLNASDVSVSNTDNDAAGITVTPTSGLTTTEAGGTAAFTVVLTSQPTANVTIGLSSSNTAEGTVSPSSVTFTSGNWNTPQTVTVTGVDDFLVDGAVAYAVVTAAATSSDLSYSGLNASDVSVTNSDNDAAGITVTPTGGLTTTEAGGAATFTVVLMSQPTANVTIGLSSSNTAEGTVSPTSVTFTSGNWNTPQTVTVTGVDDFLVDGAVAYTIVTAAATSSDLNYSGLNASDVSVSNTDNDAAGITVTPTSGLTTTEGGGAAAFTVVLTSQPTANVTIGISSSNTAEGTVSPSSVTFTSGNWNTPQPVTATGVDDFLVDGAVAYTVVTAAATSSDLNYSGLNAGDVSITNTDNDSAGITVTPTSGLTTTEAGGAATFTVVLTSQPTANVTVGLSSSNAAEGTVSPSSVTFTTGNWNTPQTVTVTGVDDFLVDGAVVYTVVTAAATSSDLNYSGLNASDVSVTNSDNDAAGITVTPTSGLTTTEAGGAATFTVVLTSQPTANVTIGVSSSNTAEGTVSPSSVTFTSGNWNTPQTVTVTGVDDFLVDGAQAYTIVTAAATSSDVHYSGLNASDVSVTNTDNDAAGITVTPTSGLTTTEAGGAATFTVVLTSQPTANVTIGLSSSDTAEGTVAPSNVTFTSGNWNTPQTVTVTGVDDFLVDGAVGYTIVTAAATSSDVHYSGLDASDVSVTNTDNDAAGITVTPTSGLTTTEAGGAATFTVVLASQPTANVTIGVSSSNIAEGTVSPTSVTFTSGNWNTAQTVTVTGVDDFLVDGAQAYTIVTAAATSSDLSYLGLNAGDVSVSNTDNDAAGITVTPTSGLTTTEAGGAATFTVVLTSQPTANVTIGLSSSNTAEGAVAPSSVTFTSGNWTTPQTVTVTGVDDFLVDGAVAYTVVTAAATSSDIHYSGLNASDVSVTNTDNDAAGITVSPTSGLTTTEAGGAATFTVVLASQPTANVTIGVSSSNTAEGTVSPSSVTFTSSNWNTPQTVTVTGVDDFLVDGAQAYTIVTAAATSSDLSYLGLNASDVSVSNTDNDAAGITVTPTAGLVTTEAGTTASFTVRLNSQPIATVTIALVSSNLLEGVATPVALVFTGANWNTPQTVTVTGVDDLVVDGAVNYSVVTAAAVSTDGNYSGLNASDVSVTNTDNDAAGIAVTPTSGLTTTEAGGTATFTVVLTSQPTANVTVGLSSSNAAEGTVSPSSVTFTSGNWNIPQTVTVTGVDDFLVDGAQAYTIVTAAATSSDTNYSGLNASDVSVTNADNDAAGITVTPTSGLTTTEAGGTATFTVVLTSQPTANVTIGLSSSNTAEGTVSPSSVTFTSANWNTSQTVTVTGVDDFAIDGPVAYTIVTAAATSTDSHYSSVNTADVSVTNTDNDAAGITVTPTSGLTTTEAGGTATFTIVLNTLPSSNVIIALSSSNTAEGSVSPSSVTFTSANWNTPQTVTVTGVDDLVLDGPVAYTIVTAPAVSADTHYNGVNASDVSATNTDNDTASSLQADLVVAITDAVTDIRPGQSLSYTVTVSNQGPALVNGATLTVGTLSGATLGAWTCTASVGSSCGSATGTGAVNVTLMLPAGGAATVHVAATVSDAVSESVTTTATATMPAGQTDPVPTNNTARDVDSVETPRIGVTLTAGTPSVSGPASFDVPYTIEVSSQGGVPATNLQVIDSLSSAFTTGRPTLSMAIAPSATAPCAVNGNYSGIGDSSNLLSATTLGVGQSCTISMAVRVAYPSPESIPAAAQVNKVTVTAGSAGQARAESETSVKLLLPRVDITQALTSVTQVGEEPVFDLGFQIVVRNTSEADAHNVQVVDNLSKSFSAGAPSITIQSGPVIEVLSVASAQAVAGNVASASVAVVGTAGLTLAPDFNGTTVTTLLRGDDTMPAGREQTITMTVRLTYPGSNAVPVDVDLSNEPVVTTSVTPGGTVITRDESTDVTTAAADPTADDTPHPTVIRLTPTARLVVQKVSSARVAEIGDTVQYAVRVSNVGSSKLPATTVTDQLPIGFRYVDGSARLLGDGTMPVRMPEPVSRGGVLTFAVPDQQTNAATITYRLRLGPGADRSDGINVAQAASGSARSGAARARVRVAGGVFATDACIIGKIFADLDGNGVQRVGEPGIPGVHLTIEDGTTLISDGAGQYSYCGLSPTTHVIVVDPASLPTGARLTPAGSRNAGDGRSQFVDVKNGELRRVDFVENSRERSVLAEIEARRVADAEWRPRFAPEQRPPTPVAQAASAADASRVIAIGGTSMSLAEMLEPARQNVTGPGAAGAAMSASPGVAPAPFTPGVRSMLMVGLLDGVLSLNTEKSTSRLALSPGTAFERELTRLSGTFADGRGRYAGRGAVFLKGQTAGDIGITVAYDSEKTGGTTLFRDIQPDAFYPITGDSSRKIFDAQSSSRLYARVERGRSFALFGDVLATTLGGDGRRLGAFNRALTGVQSRVEAGRVTLAGFASHTALKQVVDEIVALGLSGPYSVSHPNGVSGSERVEIITRDRNQPAVVLRAQPMTRLTDYEFEPFTGRLLFRRPIPTLDERMNPMSIRITYEIDTTLDGAEPVKAWVGGVDAALRVTKDVEFGGNWIDDATTGSTYRLRSANSTIRFGSSTTLLVEGATTRGTAASGALLTTVATANAEGAAARLELKHHSSRMLARAFVATAQSGFSNPSSGLTPGRTEAGASAVATISPSVKITADAVHSEDQATGATRDGATVAVDATIARALGIEVGVRRSVQSATTGGGAAALAPSSTDGFGLGPNGTAIDPVSGLPLSRPGLTSTLATSSTTPTPAIDETTVRARVVFMPSTRANVYAEAEQDIRESAKRMAAVGLQVQVSTLNRAYARHEFISSLDSPYALTGAVRRDATVIGLASAVTSNSDVFSEYRMRNAIDGRDAEAAIGLRNQWTLAEGLHVSTSVERLQAVVGTRRESTAATGGVDFTRLQGLKATTRLEWRQDLTTQSWLSTLGVAERLSSSWTLLAKHYYQWVQQRSAAGQMQSRFSIGGAFRNPTANRLNMLSRYELRVDRTFGAPDDMNIYRRVQSVSTHVDFQPARGWTLSGQHAAKWVDDRTDGTPESTRAQLLSGRLGVDVFSRLDVGALGSLMWGTGGGREQALGAEVGVLLRGNWWLSFGDNAVGFRDTDFEIANTTTRGPFTRLRLKFD